MNFNPNTAFIFAVVFSGYRTTYVWQQLPASLRFPSRWRSWLLSSVLWYILWSYRWLAAFRRNTASETSAVHHLEDHSQERLTTFRRILLPLFVESTVTPGFFRCQVLTIAGMKMAVFWDVLLPSVVGIYRRFRRAYCLHHCGAQGFVYPTYQWRFRAVRLKTTLANSYMFAGHFVLLANSVYSVCLYTLLCTATSRFVIWCWNEDLTIELLSSAGPGPGPFGVTYGRGRDHQLQTAVWHGNIVSTFIQES
jgi:hypothetical protein